MRILLEIIKYISLMITVLSSLFPASTHQTSAYETEFQDLGIPLQAYYSDGIPGRSAWDVEVIDGKLFVASGDYDKNIGPVHIFHYDLNEKQWIESGTVSDEQIEQFYLINGKLMAPGSDPKQDWNLGNIYIYENGQWITKRTIAGGIHQLDMMEFDGQTFVALGVLPGQIPVVASTDGCESFREIPMYKDGELFSTSLPEDITVTSAVVRCYDFFVCNDTLYTFYYQQFNGQYQMIIFRYQNGAFHYHSDLPNDLSYRRISFEIFKAKTEHQGKSYFTTGKLYVSEDMITAEEIILEDDAIVSDLRVINGRLYAMSVKKTEDGNYTVSMWAKKLLSENKFQKLYYFTYPCTAQSFTYHDGHFYFGMGDGTLSETNPANGSVLSVKYPV